MAARRYNNPSSCVAFAVDAIGFAEQKLASGVIIKGSNQTRRLQRPGA